MAKNKIICTTNNVEYITIRRAMISGARTIEELIDMVDVCANCEGCSEHLEHILGSVCGCMNVSLEEVVNAIKNGADTVEKVGEITGAGTKEGCGKCKALISNVIELGR